MELQGKIIQVLGRQEGVGQNGNPWAIQPYVLETKDQYPRKVQFDIFGDDKIKQNLCCVDDEVTISFDIESREFNGRWYTSVRVWKVVQADEEAHNKRLNAITFDAQNDSSLGF